MDLEKSDKLGDINAILDESFPPYFTDTFSPWEVKEQLNTHTINGLSSFIADVNDGIIGGIRGWSNTMTWSSADYNHVTYSSWTITLSNGFSYSITGATVTLTTVTYIYLDTAISITALQTTTTASTSVWGTKILVAVANLTVSWKQAQFQVFWWLGWNVFITADNIAANSITSNEIATNTITANNLSTALLYAWSITLDTNGVIKSWQTAYNTWTGFWLGDVSGTKKLSIGDGTNSLTWNWTILWITGAITSTATITWGTIQTASSWARVVMTGNVFTSYDSGWTARFLSNGSWFRLNDDTWAYNLDIQWVASGGVPAMKMNGRLLCDLISWNVGNTLNVYTNTGIVSFWAIWASFPWYISAPDDYTIAISSNKFSIWWLILEKSWTNLLWNGVRINP